MCPAQEKELLRIVACGLAEQEYVLAWQPYCKSSKLLLQVCKQLL